MKLEIKQIIVGLIIAGAMAAGAAVDMTAQEYVNTPVTVSKDKVRVNGEICWSHVVLERQTLFSISKAYDVSLDEIYRVNPSLKTEGLKKNAIILIPVPQQKPQETASSQEKDQAQEKAQHQNMTANRLGKESADQTKEEKAARKQDKKVRKQTVHVSRWYEDIYIIAEHYGVTPEAIMQANKMKTPKLKNRQKLIIPEKTAIEVAVVPEEDEITGAAEEVRDSADVEVNEQQPSWVFIPKDKVKATMLLPLTTADGRISRNNMDFYSGALLAVYDLAEKGISTDFSMLDITDNSHPVTFEDIDGSDVVIGPVSSSDISRLLESFPPSTMVVSPLDPKVEDLVDTHRNLIQAPTPARIQYEDLTEWIRDDLTPADTVLLISEKAFKQSEAAKTMMEVMDSSGISYNSFSYNILEGRDVIEPLKLLMTKYGTNRVMIASESEAFVNDVVRNMNLMLYEQYKVVLYAPSKIRSFDTIEVEHFHKVNMHVSLTYYIDYDDQRVRDFLLKYRALFNTEPSQFAFQGYDMATYFINLCSRYGDRWPAMVSEAPQAMLQSTFRFKRDAEEEGYINNGIRRLIYDEGWSVYEAK